MFRKLSSGGDVMRYTTKCYTKGIKYHIYSHCDTESQNKEIFCFCFVLFFFFLVVVVVVVVFWLKIRCNRKFMKISS